VAGAEVKLDHVRVFHQPVVRLQAAAGFEFSRHGLPLFLVCDQVVQVLTHGRDVHQTDARIPVSPAQQDRFKSAVSN